MKGAKKYSVIRRGRTIVALVVLGVLTGGLVLGVNTLAERMQIFSAVLALSFVAVAFWVGLTLLLGRIYCSTLCPVGTLSDAVSRIGQHVRVRRHTRKGRSAVDLGYRYRAPLERTRAITLLAAIGLIIIGLPAIASFFDPFDAYRRTVHVAFNAATAGVAGIVAAWLFLVVVLMPALRRGRLICNSVCPVGTALGMMSRVALYHPDINTDLCTGCGECMRVCKAECIDPSAHTIDLSRCVVCFNCMDVCPSGAITFRRGFHSLQSPLMQKSTEL